MSDKARVEFDFSTCIFMGVVWACLLAGAIELRRIADALEVIAEALK